MFSTTHTLGSRIRTPKRLVTTAALAVSAVLLAGCASTATADIDVSEQGQVAYACALAAHVQAEHGSPDTWTDYIGDDTAPGARELSSIGMFTMGAESGALSDIGTQLVEGISRVDIAALISGLDEAQAACEDIEGTDDADVSHDAQLAYACAVADRVVDEHGDAASWLGEGVSAAWYEAAGAAALTGASNGQTLADAEELCGWARPPGGVAPPRGGSGR